MTKLGVGIDGLKPITTRGSRGGWGGPKAEQTWPLRLNRVRQCDTSWAPVDPEMSRQVPPHQMSAVGLQLRDIQGVKQLRTLHERQAFVIKYRDTTVGSLLGSAFYAFFFGSLK